MNRMQTSNPSSPFKSARHYSHGGRPKSSINLPVIVRGSFSWSVSPSQGVSFLASQYRRCREELGLTGTDFSSSPLQSSHQHGRDDVDLDRISLLDEELQRLISWMRSEGRYTSGYVSNSSLS